MLRLQHYKLNFSASSVSRIPIAQFAKLAVAKIKNINFTGVQQMEKVGLSHQMIVWML